MPTGQGSSVSLRIGKETSYGTTGATSYEVPFMPTLDIKETQALNDSAVIRGVRSMDRSFLGFKALDGSVTIPVDTKSFPKFLEGFFSTPVTTGVGPYVHTFSVNDTAIPSMFMEVAHEDLNLFYLHNGIKMNSFDISFGGDGELSANINLMGQKTTKGVAEVLVPTALANNNKFEQFHAVVTGATSVKDISLNYTNNLDGSQYVIGDGGVRGEIPLGMAGVSFTFTALYEDDTLLAAARNNTDQAFNITLTNGADVMSFDLAECVLEPTGVTVDSPQGLTQTFNGSAFWKSDAANSAIVIAVTNDEATV